MPRFLWGNNRKIRFIQKRHHNGIKIILRAIINNNIFKITKILPFDRFYGPSNRRASIVTGRDDRKIRPLPPHFLFVVIDSILYSPYFTVENS